MSNITFLISAMLTVLLLQGVEQTRLTTSVVDIQVKAPSVLLNSVKNEELSLKASRQIESDIERSILIDHPTVLTKS